MARGGGQIDERARLEDLRWFIATGERASGAARRLGVTTTALEKWCRVHGHADLWRQLMDRERVGAA